MKWEVKLYVGGKVFTEEVYASNHQDARETATARNPRAKVIGINPSWAVEELAHNRLCGRCFRVFYKSQRISPQCNLLPNVIPWLLSFALMPS